MGPKANSSQPKARVRAVKREVRVGVAGWSIPSRYQEQLPGEGSHLERYSARLNAVEINSSFHRPHRAQTYERWARNVPAQFRFSVKTPRELTHENGLVANADVLDRFREEVSGLGAKLGVLLVQLPPKLEFERRTANRFFAALRKRIDVSIVCEPRHSSWASERADAFLTDNAIARVAADPPPWAGAEEPGGYDKLIYFRWHGQPRKYYSDYGQECLAKLQTQMAAAQASQVWAIFDNTVHGFALGNALAVSGAVAEQRLTSNGAAATAAPSTVPRRRGP